MDIEEKFKEQKKKFVKEKFPDNDNIKNLNNFNTNKIDISKYITKESEKEDLLLNKQIQNLNEKEKEKEIEIENDNDNVNEKNSNLQINQTANEITSLHSENWYFKKKNLTNFIKIDKFNKLSKNLKFSFIGKMSKKNWLSIKKFSQ